MWSVLFQHESHLSSDHLPSQRSICSVQVRARSPLPRRASSSKPEKKRDDDDEEDPSKQKRWSMRETVSWFKKSKPNTKEKNTNYPDRESTKKTKEGMLKVLKEKPKKEESLDTTKPKATAKAGFTPGNRQFHPAIGLAEA